MKKVLQFALIIFVSNLQSQNIDFGIINKTFNHFTKDIESSGQYFISKNYYQAKVKDFNIRLYDGIGNIAVIQFKNQIDFDKFALNIINNAYFDYKYCSDYNAPIVFNFHTDLGNKIRFSFDEWQVSVEYPNTLSNFADSNKDFLPVFICDSDNSYAYHTNLRCGNLNNCKSDIKKTNIRQARTYRYKNICEVCSTLQ